MIQRAFHPREGAVLDLGALQAIAEEPNRALDAIVSLHAAGTSGLILEGLEVIGQWTAAGPPGTVRLDPGNPGISLTPGMAIVTDSRGLRRVVRVEEQVLVPWPTSAGMAVKAVLSLSVEVTAETGASGLSVARDAVKPVLRFEKLDQFDQPDRLPIVVATGNNLDWATDLRRMLPPEHPVVLKLIKDIEAIERVVWEAEPEGSVWDKSVLGRSWVRYQTIASSALQAARMSLETQPLSSLGRARVLASLRRKMEETVPSAGNRLVQLVGPADLPGPYRKVLPGK